MATLAFPSAGSKLYICTSNAPPATFDAAGFGAQTYVEVKELTNIGVIGKVFSLITHEPVGDPTTYKFKGTSNSGQLALQGAYAPTDPGQAKLLVALDDPLAYSFKLTIGGGTTGTPQATLYFQGQVMSAPINVGSVNQITSFDTNVEVSGNFYKAP